MNKTKILLSIFSIGILYSCGENALTSGSGIGTITSAKADPFFKGAESYLNFTLEDIEKSVDFATKEIEKAPDDHKGYALRAQVVYMNRLLSSFTDLLGNSSGTSSYLIPLLKESARFNELYNQAASDLEKAEKIKADSLEVYRVKALKEYSLTNPSSSLADKIITIDPNDMVGLFLKYHSSLATSDSSTNKGNEKKENQYEKKLKELYPNFIPFKFASMASNKFSYNTYDTITVTQTLDKVGLANNIIGSILSYKLLDKSQKDIYQNTLIESLKISPKNINFRQQLSALAASAGDFNKSLSLMKEMCDDLKEENSCEVAKAIDKYSEKISALKTPEDKKKSCLEDLTGKDKFLTLYSTECKPSIDEFINTKTKEFMSALPSPKPSSSSESSKNNNSEGSTYYIPSNSTPYIYGDDDVF